MMYGGTVTRLPGNRAEAAAQNRAPPGAHVKKGRTAQCIPSLLI